MENLEQIIKNVLENQYIGTNYDGNYKYSIVKNAMIEFARQMCELQKEVCAENAKAISNAKEVNKGSFTRVIAIVDKQSIINTPNVCEL